MADRRAFLQGLVSLPLIGGGVTLIGRPSAAVPLVQAAALPTLDDPRQRALYAWEAFSGAMRELTADAHGWRILGAGDVRGRSYIEPYSYLRVAAVHYETGAERRISPASLIVERHREFDLSNPSVEINAHRAEPFDYA